jgi:hypothetical protein
MTENGILYVATGEEFVNEAELSARTVQAVMPDIPIAIATDVEPTFDFDYVIEISDPAHGFVDKITNISLSPFDRTLYLDTDIYLDSDVSELFDLLDRFDIAVAHNHNREVYNPPGIPASFPEYNTGVIVYENDSRFAEFASDWADNHAEILATVETHDQPSFRKTLFESDLQIATLTPEYNCMVRYPGHVRNPIKIAHARLLDIETPGEEMSVDAQRSVEKLNSLEGHRLFLPRRGKGVAILYSTDGPIYKRVINSFRRHGIRHTIKTQYFTKPLS